MLTASYLPASAARLAASWQDSSAQTGHRPRQAGQRRVGAGRQRLLDQLDAERRQLRRQRRVDLRRPGLVGVDDQARRAARSHARPARARDRRRPPSFSFSSGRSALARAAAAMLSTRVEAQRVGGDGGPGRRQPRQLPDRTAGPLRLEVPQRAVDRVARGAGRHRGLQRLRGRGRARARDAQRFDRLRWRRRSSRRSADRARIRRGRDGRRRATSTTTTSASVLLPREIVKVPAIGQLSARTVSRRISIFASTSTMRADAGAQRDRRPAGRYCQLGLAQRAFGRRGDRAPRC